MQVEDVMREDAETFNSKEMAFFRERIDHIDREVNLIQGKLKNFEAQFFN